MSDSTLNQTTSTPSKRKVDATRIVDSFILLEGVSAKTGNPYCIGTLYIKTKSGKRPYALDLKYLDDNALSTVEEALEHYNDQEREDFAKGVQG
ncbi:MAG: hypothetical protein WBP12_05305 [Candidatus Saccharimonas sp.]